MASIPQDDFKWFGEGFTGFPKHLPEDVVSYTIFILNPSLSDLQTRERLQSFQRALATLTKTHLQEYIWQRDSISLSLHREKLSPSTSSNTTSNNTGIWLLKGETNYGDSIADEWLIVYLLVTLSSQIPDAWLRIHDSDGEFLLIEAANVLPRWLTPEVAENRVWIHNNRLLVIPLLKKKSVPPGPLELAEAVEILKTSPASLLHDKKVEEEAFHRLSTYPSAIPSNQHHAIIPLPRKLAHVLHLHPNYIAPIVEAFYLRDPVSLRLIQPAKSGRALVFPPEDFVIVSVRFTKILFAQLRSQEWSAPEPWRGKVGEIVGTKEGKGEGGEEGEERVGTSVRREKAEIGIKVAAGAEMLIASQLYASKRVVQEIQLLLEDLETGDDDMPTDMEIRGWEKREDDESWLDIDFRDFERELAAKTPNPKTNPNSSKETVIGGEGSERKKSGDTDTNTDAQKTEKATGTKTEKATGTKTDKEAGNVNISVAGADFGTTPALENLRKMTARFNAFLEDDNADLSGARDLGLDPMDMDNDSLSSSSDHEPGIGWEDPEDSSDDEGGPEDFDEEEYKAVLGRFMGLNSAEKSALTDEARRLALETEESEEEEEEEIRRLSEAMEKELFGHGALELNPESKFKSKSKGGMKDKGKGKGRAPLAAVAEESNGTDGDVDEDGDGDEDDLLDEDFNLVDNMLKAFKGQAGMPGPAGNLMAMMGIQMPRDADDERRDSEHGEGSSSKSKS
ncbi:SGT1 protein-domain-containing protein [Clohesyomyces aquaticus]|uniref:SGT1 protein-domain-containing protein n=1 Tax=Clohesyomyces aquaticus TaxID=1231657 RepID=A0A1Y1Z3A3_9PLEO|nr:SGT1 protein-domain-containing protein [Clohesyomyces aquaticus]